MSSNKAQTENKDAYSVSKQNVDRYFNDLEKAVPQYLQSITNLQQECTKTWKKTMESVISIQQEFAGKFGMNANLPGASSKAADDITEQVIKAQSVQNQAVLATIDAIRQNVKIVNENADSFAQLNRNIMQSWISAWNTARS